MRSDLIPIKIQLQKNHSGHDNIMWTQYTHSSNSISRGFCTEVPRDWDTWIHSFRLSIPASSGNNLLPVAVIFCLQYSPKVTLGLI